MFVADIWLECLIRICVNLFLRLRSLKWPELEGQIDAINLKSGFAVGCTVAEVHYSYSLHSHRFDSCFKKPYVITGRANDYVLDHPRGTKARIKVNPNDSFKSFLIGS